MAVNQEGKYKLALDRLTSDTPGILNVGTYGINNDAVAMEAGSKRGAIKKARYPDLVDSIKLAAKIWEKKKVSPAKKEKAKKEKAISDNSTLMERFEASLKREFELALRLDELEKDIVALKSKVVPFNKNT